jgi:hypothetical protein
MYQVTKVTIIIKIIVLLTGLLAATGVGAATPLFDSGCADNCHGVGNAGSTNPETGFVTPPVQDTSFAGIKNSITPVPFPDPDLGHFTLNIIYNLPGTYLTDEYIAAISAELNPPSGCVPPQELVNGVCAIPTTPSCAAPQVLVNGVCTNPTETPTSTSTACDDRANTALCINQRHQTGSLGSEESADAKADIYKVICPKPAVALRASISGLTADNPARVSVQVSKGRVDTPVIVDATPGDGIISGRPALLAKGSGVYKVKINKEKTSVPGIVQYDATISCLAKNRAKLRSRIVIKKNQ